MTTEDLWWNNNWGNHQDVLAVTHEFTAGEHTVEIYGAEGCCDGN